MMIPNQTSKTTKIFEGHKRFTLNIYTEKLCRNLTETSTIVIKINLQNHLFQLSKVCEFVE